MLPLRNTGKKIEKKRRKEIDTRLPLGCHVGRWVGTRWLFTWVGTRWLFRRAPQSVMARDCCCGFATSFLGLKTGTRSSPILALTFPFTAPGAYYSVSPNHLRQACKSEKLSAGIARDRGI